MIKSVYLKLIMILTLLILFTTILLPSCSYALNPKEYMNTNQFDNYENAWNKELGGKSGFTIKAVIQNALNVVLTIVRAVALGWAILMGISIAIKYMSGSSQIKSQIKIDLPTYLIGAVILFGAAGLLTFIKFIAFEVFVVE